MAYTLKQLEDAMAKNHSTRQDFLKHLLSLSSAMLAILAAFHTTHNGGVRFLFLASLVLLSLGILSGGIVLYFDTVAAKSILAQIKQEILRELSNPSATSDTVSYNPPKLFFVCGKLCYISLLLAVVCVTFYAGLNT